MSGIERRLSALETETGTRQSLTARDESYLAWLSTPSLPAVVREHAEDKAERRFLDETGRVAGTPTPGGGWYVTVGDGWVWHTDEAERDTLTRYEVRELEPLLSLYELHDALAIWANEADVRGWPLLWRSPSGYTEFLARLARDRQAMDSHRGASGDLAREWRRRNPEWFAGMDAATYDAWEATL